MGMIEKLKIFDDNLISQLNKSSYNKIDYWDIRAGSSLGNNIDFYQVRKCKANQKKSDFFTDQRLSGSGHRKFSKNYQPSAITALQSLDKNSPMSANFRKLPCHINKPYGKQVLLTYACDSLINFRERHITPIQTKHFFSANERKYTQIKAI